MVDVVLRAVPSDTGNDLRLYDFGAGAVVITGAAFVDGDSFGAGSISTGVIGSSLVLSGTYGPPVMAGTYDLVVLSGHYAGPLRLASRYGPIMSAGHYGPISL